MDNDLVSTEIDAQAVNFAISTTSNFLSQALAKANLPCDNLLVDDKDKINVLKNINSLIAEIPNDRLPNAYYMSKFIVATFAGLFDAALNYLWDETVLELRKRVVAYDLEIFYTNIVNENNRNKFQNEEDLKNLSDQDLLEGCKNIDLIDNVTYKELDHIKYMRNWVSAAHPNNYDLTGFKMLGYLETCIKIIKTPTNQQTVAIKRILSNIKFNIIDDEQAKLIKSQFSTFSQNQANSLCLGLFGIYVKTSTTTDTISNIEKIIDALWVRTEVDIRKQIGFKYSNFSMQIENEKKDLTERFLTIVKGLQYLTDDVKAAKIKNVLDNLLRAHNEWGNFYSEPPYARELKDMIGDLSIPVIIEKDYVSTIVKVFLTNGNGICDAGDRIYRDLINKFNESQAKLALLSFTDVHIQNKLFSGLCRSQYKELVFLIEGKIIDVLYRPIIDIILTENISLNNLHEDARIKEKLIFIKRTIK